MNLTDLANKYGTDKGTKVGRALGYTAFYEEMFGDLRGKPIRLLEIGVHDPRFPGASLKMWEEYFPNAEIFGIDIIDCRKFDTERVRTFQVDQGDRGKLVKFVSESGGDFDIVVDDGSHRCADVLTSLGVLFPAVKLGGIYFIEDIASWIDYSTALILRSFIDTGEIENSIMAAGEQRFIEWNHEGRVQLQASSCWLLAIGRK